MYLYNKSEESDDCDVRVKNGKFRGIFRVRGICTTTNLYTKTMQRSFPRTYYTIIKYLPFYMNPNIAGISLFTQLEISPLILKPLLLFCNDKMIYYHYIFLI